MKLYEYEEALDQCFDPETGEIDEEKMDALQWEYGRKAENLVKSIKDDEAEADSIDAEIKRLMERKKAKQARAKSKRAYLQRVLDGSKYECPAGSISYRKTSVLEIVSADAFIKWAETAGHEELLRRTVEVRKDDVKRLLTGPDAFIVPEGMAAIVTRQSMVLK